MVIDWIAAGITLVSVYMIGCKRKSGFLIGGIGCIAWCFVGLNTKAYGMLGSSIPLFFMNLYCWFKWRKQEKEDNIPPSPREFYKCTRLEKDALICSFLGGMGECRKRVPPQPFQCWIERDYGDKDATDPTNWQCNRKDKDGN